MTIMRQELFLLDVYEAPARLHYGLMSPWNHLLSLKPILAGD